jgi:hypothetical protein
MATSELALEMGPQDLGIECDCCGVRSTTVHGFVYQRGNAFAVYYAGWSQKHPDRGVTLAIATGEWGEGSSPADRVSIGLKARSSEDEIQFTVLTADESPWGDTPMFGKMLQRKEALSHPRLAQTFAIADLIVDKDERVHRFLWGPPAH